MEFSCQRPAYNSEQNRSKNDAAASFFYDNSVDLNIFKEYYLLEGRK